MYRRIATAALLTLAVAASGGCKQSLFEDGAGDDPDVVGTTCPAECLGDAARDFQAATPKRGWRYVEDRRNRTWVPMTAASKRAVGEDPANGFTTCADKPGAAACAALPGALLVSTAGGSSAADPALEFTVTSKRVAKLGVRVLVPADAPEQQLRIYRNSREDSLFTGSAAAGTLLEQVVSADVLPGDRLLLAFAPASGGATDIGVELFISDVGTPSSCKIGLTFDGATGNTVTNACGAAFTSYQYQDVGDDTEVPPTLGPGPFMELGQAAVIAPGKYYKGLEVPSKAGDVTLQFWMQAKTVNEIYGSYAYSDHDLDNTGGVSVDLYSPGRVIIESLSCTRVNGGAGGYAGTFVDYPNSTTWQFVRLVHTGSKVTLCINNKQALNYALPGGKLTSSYPPYLGKNVKWSPGAFFDGAMDDVRLLSTALPCE
ncbi:MAG: hypothetical protein IPI49_09255 [Myxococcales bacterium]|nr:hypothetical protein [Myxococcales bacterium]HRC55484.1 hypothetical protein [Kofleriaceae bacterium]